MAAPGGRCPRHDRLVRVGFLWSGKRFGGGPAEATTGGQFRLNTEASESTEEGGLTGEFGRGGRCICPKSQAAPGGLFRRGSGPKTNSLAGLANAEPAGSKSAGVGATPRGVHIVSSGLENRRGDCPGGAPAGAGVEGDFRDGEGQDSGCPPASKFGARTGAFGLPEEPKIAEVRRPPMGGFRGRRPTKLAEG